MCTWYIFPIHKNRKHLNKCHGAVEGSLFEDWGKYKLNKKYYCVPSECVHSQLFIFHETEPDFALLYIE